MNNANGWIVQRKEDHPHNPGWWRFGRPYWVARDHDLPDGFPDAARWSWGPQTELVTAQSAWDIANPGG